MRSLKRSRNEPPQSERGQKRVCSNSDYESAETLAQRCLLNALTKPTIVGVPQQALHSNVPMRCIHRRFTACSLSQPICCACADTGAVSNSDQWDADGLDDTTTHGRWKYYCPDCRANRETRSILMNLPFSKPLRSLKTKVVGDIVKVSCADLAFDFIRSDDLTFDDLRLEVSRLMRCNPCQLMVVASDIDLDMATEGVVLDITALMSNASRIHFKIVDSADSEDEEMEDV